MTENVFIGREEFSYNWRKILLMAGEELSHKWQKN